MSQNSKRLRLDPKSKLRVGLDFLAHQISTYFSVFGPSYSFSSAVLAVIRVHPGLKVMSKRLVFAALLLTWDFHSATQTRTFCGSLERTSVTAYAYEYLHTGYLMNVKRLHSLESSGARQPPIIGS